MWGPPGSAKHIWTTWSFVRPTGEIRDAVQELLEDPLALARARDRSARIRDAFDWEAILPRFEAVVTGSDQPPAGG